MGAGELCGPQLQPLRTLKYQTMVSENDERHIRLCCRIRETSSTQGGGPGVVLMHTALRGRYSRRAVSEANRKDSGREKREKDRTGRLKAQEEEKEGT